MGKMQHTFLTTLPPKSTAFFWLQSIPIISRLEFWINDHINRFLLSSDVAESHQVQRTAYSVQSTEDPTKNMRRVPSNRIASRPYLSIATYFYLLSEVPTVLWLWYL